MFQLFMFYLWHLMDLIYFISNLLFVTDIDRLIIVVVEILFQQINILQQIFLKLIVKRIKFFYSNALK